MEFLVEAKPLLTLARSRDPVIASGCWRGWSDICEAAPKARPRPRRPPRSRRCSWPWSPRPSATSAPGSPSVWPAPTGRRPRLIETLAPRRHRGRPARHRRQSAAEGRALIRLLTEATLAHRVEVAPAAAPLGAVVEAVIDQAEQPAVLTALAGNKTAEITRPACHGWSTTPDRRRAGRAAVEASAAQHANWPRRSICGSASRCARPSCRASRSTTPPSTPPWPPRCPRAPHEARSGPDPPPRTEAGGKAGGRRPTAARLSHAGAEGASARTVRSRAGKAGRISGWRTSAAR